MSPMIAGIIGIVLMLVLLFARMPIGFAMALVDFLGFAYLKGIDSAFGLVGSLPYKQFSSYTFSVAPLFILMGNLCFASGISADLFRTANAWLGHLRGGLAIAAVGACTAFAAVSGSSMATAATMATVALPEMKRYNYNSALATGVIAASGTLGAMIPPSLGFIFYGIMTEQSIGKLFIAGIVPGLVQAAIYIIVVIIMCRRDPHMGPPTPWTPYPEKFKTLAGAWSVALLFVVIMGGIYAGVFSANEAGGIGAFGAFAIALARRKMSWKSFHTALLDTVKVGSMAIIIVTGVLILNSFLAVSRLPAELGAFITGLQVNGYIIIAFIMVLFLILGMVMDPLSMLLLTIPIVFPVVKALGFDLIWFGVLVTAMGEIGVITPPVGINVFVVQGIAKDVPMYTVFKGIIWFFIGDIILMVILIAFPQISLFLPNLMK
jgi:C4-dicarboxylate transporter, DctM subunit